MRGEDVKPVFGPPRPEGGGASPPAPPPAGRPRLLVLTQSYWPELAGSAPMMAELAAALAAAGTPTTVLTARPNYPAGRVRADYARGAGDHQRVEGVDIERVFTLGPREGRVRQRLLHEGGLHLAFLAARLRGRIGRFPAVLSLCPSILSVLVADRCRQAGGRHVAVVHDIQSGLAGALGMSGAASLAPLRALERAALNRADAVVALSDAMRDALVGQGVRTPITVLPPHVDAQRLRPRPRPQGAPPTVQYSGAFAAKQGLEQILALAQRLGRLRPEARVVLRGSGGREAELRARSAELGLVNLHFEPPAGRERLAESLAEGDVHLVPQRAEGAAFAMPGKAVTIMAAARPFVAMCAAGSPLERLGRRIGAFAATPPGDAEALTAAVLDLLDHPEAAAAMGRRGRAWVEANADLAVVGARYAELLGLESNIAQGSFAA